MMSASIGLSIEVPASPATTLSTVVGSDIFMVAGNCGVVSSSTHNSHGKLKANCNLYLEVCATGTNDAYRTRIDAKCRWSTPANKSTFSPSHFGHVCDLPLQGWRDANQPRVESRFVEFICGNCTPISIDFRGSNAFSRPIVAVIVTIHIYNEGARWVQFYEAIACPRWLCRITDML